MFSSFNKHFEIHTEYAVILTIKPKFQFGLVVYMLFHGQRGHQNFYLDILVYGDC